MRTSSMNLTVYFIEKSPGDILKGLGWIKLDYDIAQRFPILDKYNKTITIPNSQPYCCPIHPEDKMPWFQPNYQPFSYVHLPAIKGKSNKFTLHIKGENIILYVQYSLSIEAIRSWLISWLDDKDAKLITPGNRSIFLYGNTNSKVKNVFIYFIFNDDSYAIKIGRAANVEKRLQSLQTSSPVTLQVLKAIPVGSLKKAQEIEKGLHAKFAHLRISGEWFRATPQLREYIAACDASYFQSSVSDEPLPRRSVRLSEL